MPKKNVTLGSVSSHIPLQPGDVNFSQAERGDEWTKFQACSPSGRPGLPNILRQLNIL